MLLVENAKKWSWQSQTSELILIQCYSVLRKYILYFSNAHFRYDHSNKMNWEIISEDRNRDYQRHNKGYSLKRMEIGPAWLTKELTPLPGRNLTISVQLDKMCYGKVTVSCFLLLPFPHQTLYCGPLLDHEGQTQSWIKRDYWTFVLTLFLASASLTL